MCVSVCAIVPVCVVLMRACVRVCMLVRKCKASLINTCTCVHACLEMYILYMT
jgi:hypothetical protein